MIYRQLNQDNSPSSNIDDNYIRAKAHSQIYRYSYPISENLSENILAMYLPSGKSTSNIVIPKIKELGVEINPFIETDNEEIWHFKEIDIHKVNEVMGFLTKGKNEQLKNKIREQKQKLKEEKLNAKQNKQSKNTK